MTKIKNIQKEVNHKKCNCENWLEHWERISGKTATVCCEKSCTNKDLQGAIVQKANTNTNTNTDYYYIIPLCTIHCTTDEEMEVLETLVTANRNLRCEEYAEVLSVG